jgi:hypothetical protein
MKQEQLEQAIRLYEMLQGLNTTGTINAYKCSQLYVELRKISRAYTNADTALCNGWLDHDQHDKKTTRLFNRIEKAVAKWLNNYEYQGILYHYHQSDPRGVALYVDIKPINRDSYNTTSLAIY